MVFDPEYELVTTEDELNWLFSEISKAPQDDPMNPLTLDVETTTTADSPMMYIPKKKKLEPKPNDIRTCELVGFGISWVEDKAAYLPLSHLDGNNFHFNSIVESVELELLDRFKPFFTQWRWCNQMERFDWGVMKERGAWINFKHCTYVEMIVTGRFFDLWKGDQGSTDAGLKHAVLREFGYKMQDFDSLARFDDGYHVERVAAETTAHYVCDDVNWARKLHRKLYAELMNGPKKRHFILNLEQGISHLVQVMEENGIPFKRKICDDQLVALKEFRPRAAEVIYAQVERQLGRKVDFSISNPNHIRKLFFEKHPDGLGIPIQGKSKKTGAAKTDEKTLGRLAPDFPIVHNTLTYRKLDKADGSFLATLPYYIHPKTGCIHSTFHQGGVVGGRFASSNPNSQNWSGLHEYSIRDNVSGVEEVIKLEVNVKDAVEVDEDEFLISADYKQAEFWGVLEVAKQLDLLELMSKGHDPYKALASKMFHMDVGVVPDVFRKRAKTRTLAMLYGEAPQSSAAKEGLPIQEVLKMAAEHAKAIDKVVQFSKDIIAAARKNGYIETYFGRIVYLKQLYESKDPKVWEKADRFAFNQFCQGSFTGDMPKIAMLRLQKVFRNDYPVLPDGTVKVPLIHNGHDALMSRGTPKVRGKIETFDLRGFIAKKKWAMEIQIPGFMLPARVDFSVGRRYGSMLSYKGETSEQMNDRILEQVEKKARGLNKSDGDSDIEKAQAIRLFLQGPPTREQATALTALLSKHPGQNIVTLAFMAEDGEQSLTIGKLPTSLGINNQESFKMIFPCEVLLDKVEENLDEIADAMELA